MLTKFPNIEAHLQRFRHRHRCWTEYRNRHIRSNENSNKLKNSSQNSSDTNIVMSNSKNVGALKRSKVTFGSQELLVDSKGQCLTHMHKQISIYFAYLAHSGRLPIRPKSTDVLNFNEFLNF